MFDYTGYENQVIQMKAAVLNPALLNGGSGSAGQAHGATVSPATAMQPMGLQVALQAQQVAAQTELTNAQAEKIRSETTAQKVENLVGVGIDRFRCCAHSQAFAIAVRNSQRLSGDSATSIYA